MKEFILNRAIIAILAFGLGGTFGIMIGKTKTIIKEVPREVIKTEQATVYRTPEACTKIIELDNKMFHQIADALEDWDFDKLVTQLESSTPIRNEYIIKCHITANN